MELSCYSSCADAPQLASNREDWLRWLGDAGGDAGDHHVDRDGQEGGEDRSESVLGTTVLWHLDHLLDDPADQVHPAHRGREGEARDDRVKGLGFQFLGNKVDSLEGLSGHFSHDRFYTIDIEIFIREGVPLSGQFSCILFF